MSLPTEVELTSKHHKMAQLQATMLTICSFIMFFVGAVVEFQPLMWLSVLGFFGGLIWFIVARARAWWDHG